VKLLLKEKKNGFKQVHNFVYIRLSKSPAVFLFNFQLFIK